MNLAEFIQNPELFGALSQIQAQSTLQVNTPRIYIHIIENNLNEPTVNPYIQPVISDFFSRNFSANFVDTDNADLLISGTVNSRQVAEEPSYIGEIAIYKVYCDATISISNGVTGEQILEKSFNKVQGSDFHSNKEAANQSLKNMSEKITEDFLPEIIEVITGLQ